MTALQQGQPAPVMVVEAQISTPRVIVQLVQLEIGRPVESYLHERDFYRLDLCLDPRPSGAGVCFRDHWPSHRLERPGNTENRQMTPSIAVILKMSVGLRMEAGGDRELRDHGKDIGSSFPQR